MPESMAKAERLNIDDPVGDRVEWLRHLFPEVFVDGKIDMEALRASLGTAVEDGPERFGLNWHGKRAARRNALAPSAGTLRPVFTDSADWDTTRNMVLEGDNLEVLKLLRKGYADRVKMIYIDPPYNTGQDFVYPDDFTDGIRNYLRITGQVGEAGQLLSSNSESSGRFHTNWLNMMFPRLRLARELLRADGAIFVSIDSTEVANLRLVLDEVFGPECFIIDLIWRKRDGAPNDRTVGSVHEHILVYGKESTSTTNRTDAELDFGLMPRTKKADDAYRVWPEPSGPDPRGRFRQVETTANAKGGRNVAALHYGVTNPHNGQVVHPRQGRCWAYAEDEMARLQREGRLYWGTKGTNVTPMRKLYLSEAKPGMTAPSILPDMPLNQHAARELEVLFDRKAVFDTPKPVELLKLLLRMGTGGDPDALVLDFFAGSGSLGHAAMALNAEDAKTRRFILVQLPEQTGDKEFPFITDLLKERLRRAAAQVRGEAPLFTGDTGFKVFRLDSSNIRRWQLTTAEDAAAAMQDAIDHVVPGRTGNDVLFEVLLRLGLDLTDPVARRQIAGQSVASVGGGVLFACLEEHVSREAAEGLALGIADWHRELEPSDPSQVVLLDSAFADDVAKTNLVKILEQRGIPAVLSL